MAENKIKYGLKNVHVAKCTEVVDQEHGTITYTYGTPKAIPGAVNLNMDPEGEDSPFYADDMVYFRTKVNNGYAGSLEMALVPDWFRTDYLNEKLDTSGVAVENANDIEMPKFALLFQFAGDQKATRHVMYNCSASRTSLTGATKEASVEPQTETMDLVADPRQDGFVKGKTTSTTSTEVYNSWFTKVHEPVVSEV